MNRKRVVEVLRVRSLQERSARGAMARTALDHRRARADEHRTWQQLDAFRAPGTSLAALQTVRDAGTLAAATKQIATETARTSMEIARDEWTVAARRVEALERLGERLAEAEAAEDDRKQINELDDLVLARRGREQR